MAQKPMEKGRGMSPIRGYPPLVANKNTVKQLFAVIGLSVINATDGYFAACSGEISDEVRNSANSAAAALVERTLSQYGSAERLGLSDEFTAWRMNMPGDSGLLDRSVGLQLDYGILERMAAQVLQELNLMVQFIVTSVYPDTDDISLALDEFTTFSEHALLLNLTNSVCGCRSEGIEELFTEDRDNTTRAKLDLEKLFFNSVITLNFPDACDYFLQIMDMELKVAEMAVSLKPRVCNRLVWIIYVLGSPPSYGPKKPLKHNVMAAIAALDAINSLEQLKEEIRRIFWMLDEDYCSEPPQSKFTQITAYILEHYQDCNLDASALCGVFDITPPSLSRMFRREMGITMLDYIHTIRLGHVKQMMLATDLSLQDISTACGYFSSWTMSRAFKKYEGITPGEYRKNCFDR